MSSAYPLRFLGYCVGGWVGLRALSIVAPAMWSLATTPAVPEFADHRPPSDSAGLNAGRTTVPAALGKSGPNDLAVPSVRARPVKAFPFAVRWSESGVDLPFGSDVSFEESRARNDPVDRSGDTGSQRPPDVTTAPAGPPSGGSGRWSATAWLLWRAETGGSAVSAPLLGGSQAGARLDYRLASGKAGQLGLYGRISRAFAGPSAEEGALGIAWRPGALPVSLMVERRQRFGPGGRNGFALLAAGGIGPRDIAPRIEIEGYAQAGIVGLPGADGFADGKTSLGYRLAPSRLTAGVGLSGSAQPGATRLDIGPELKLRLPMGPAGGRLSTEWRVRIAGDARPASGPAVTFVADF